MGVSKWVALLALPIVAAPMAVSAPTLDTRYVVRITYTADLTGIAPYREFGRCEVTRRFTEANLPEFDGFEKSVQCIPIGGR
jgi:hypothetical protein